MSLNKSKVLRTAEKYVLQGKIPAAIDEYRKVVSADPGDLTTINTLGDLYVRAGRIQDAISNFSRIADSYREGGFTLKAIAMLKKIEKPLLRIEIRQLHCRFDIRWIELGDLLEHRDGFEGKAAFAIAIRDSREVRDCVLDSTGADVEIAQGIYRGKVTGVRTYNLPVFVNGGGDFAL